MRLFKRYSVWWLDVSINGQRIRESLNTTDKREAKGLANKRITEAEQGKRTQAGVSFARLGFGEAADRYIERRRLELSPPTLVKEKQSLVKLREFFQAQSINKISADRILEYRQWRFANKVGPATINMEVGIIRRILKQAKRWHIVADDIKPLREPRSIGRALAPEQKQKLLEIASQRPEWETAYSAAILALNTTMRGCEIKGLLWADIDFFNRTITIRKSKTAAGERIIPMTAEAFAVLTRLHRRAEMFGPVELLHYIFAGLKVNGRIDRDHMNVSEFDPTRPIRTWRKAWRSLTKEAGLIGLRFHDLRHHAITELAESGASEQTIMAIAGHVSRKMLERYSHIRMEAKRAALEAITGRRSEGYGTVHGTVGDSIPVYTDLSSMNTTDNGAKKLEVATVPE
jgi:integrase